MIEVSLNGVGKYYGVNKVFDNINFEIQTGEKVGLIGRNGTGKTTVFKLIASIEKIEKYDTGSIFIRKGATIGYLDQIPIFPNDYKVMDVLNSAFEDQYSIRAEMTKLEAMMATLENQELERIMKRYGELQHTFEHMGGYEIEEKMSKVSIGLKISDEFKSRSFSTLSGGEKTTVMLGKILLQNPNILLLDEPSNHLDIEAIEWLEDFLKEYKGTVLIISHDRYFLDRVVTKIVEIEDGESSTYLGNYSYYVTEKDRLMMEQFEAFKDQQKKIKAMEEAIKRFRDWGTRADNPKMFKKAASIQKRLEKMEKIDKPDFDRAKIQIEFSVGERSGKDVIFIENLCKSFDEKKVLDGINFHVRYGEKVAVLGKNGSGKSTLFKLILNDYQPDGGEIKLGSRVNIGFLEQNISFKDESNTILDIFREHFNYNITEGVARGILAKFLFYGGDVYKRVENLSGGEKVRLKLCILMQEEINLLLLDEPTNHLDIESREMLEESISEFSGTVIFISHDRYFINKIANRITEIQNGKIKDFLGGYDYYREKKQEEKDHLIVTKEKKESKPKLIKVTVEKEDKTIEKRLAKLEEEIEFLQKLLALKDNEMEAWSTDSIKLRTIYEEKNNIQLELDSLLEEWVDLSS